MNKYSYIIVNRTFEEDVVLETTMTNKEYLFIKKIFELLNSNWQYSTQAKIFIYTKREWEVINES